MFPSHYTIDLEVALITEGHTTNIKWKAVMVHRAMPCDMGKELDLYLDPRL